jgi:hypothetical protein
MERPSARSGGTWPSTIAVVIRCHQHSAFAARLIRLVTPFVDEVIVAADEQMTEEAIGVLAEAAPTTIVRIPHVYPNERSTMYLHSLCRTGWSLRLAGDEVPSLRLLRNLRRLVADQRLTHYILPIRWLWPDERSALDQLPWSQDLHIRLFRNDDAVKHYSGLTHCGLQIVGNHRYLEAPLYHIVFLVSSEEFRRAKAARYEREQPGLKCLGIPFNEAWYLPEARQPVPQVSPVLPEDVASMSAVLGTSLEGDAPPLQLPVVSLAEVDSHWATRPWPDEAYRVRIEVEPDQKLCFASTGVQTLFVWVENGGTETWPSALATAPIIRLSYHWYRHDGTVAEFDGLRTPLPSPIGPGERILAPARIESPGMGQWILELDLVHESVRWFGANVRLPITIQR